MMAKYSEFHKFKLEKNYCVYDNSIVCDIDQINCESCAKAHGYNKRFKHELQN
jgi:hypothetical protein